MRKTIILLLVATTVINLIYWLNRCTSGPETTQQSQASDTSARQPADTTPHTVELLDVPIQVSAAGELIVDTRIKQLFDRLAEQKNEEPVDQWKHLIFTQFSDELPPQALAQLEEIFCRYVEFNLALQLLPMEGAPNLQAVLQRVQQLRKHYLGDFADAMYADWTALESFTQQYLTIMTPDRDADAAQQQLEMAAALLPEPVQQRARNMIQESAQAFSVADMARIDPAAYSRMLQEQAAVSLIETTLMFDEPAPEFMAQYEKYGAEKRELLLSEISEQDMQEMLTALRHKYFSGSDVLRVETLDRAEAF